MTLAKPHAKLAALSPVGKGQAMKYERVTTYGTAVLIDTRDDSTWGEVEAVERFYNANDELTSSIIHLDFDKAISFYVDKGRD